MQAFSKFRHAISIALLVIVFSITGSGVSAAPATAPSIEVREDAAVTAARKRLQADPSNADANLVVGRFLCFDRGEWTSGLHMLAKGSDAALAKLAAEDASVADVPIVRIVLGHDWWDYAATQQGAAKVRCQERAAFWYLTALPDAPGDEGTELRKRIATADAEAQAFYAAAGTPRPVDLAIIPLQRRELHDAPTTPVATDPITKDTTFTPDGDKPSHIEGKLAVPGDKHVNLTFAAGYELRGGTIDLGTRGHLIIKGTADKPVIFRDVTVFQDLGASMDAEHAVLDNCHFNKGGVWYASYSSKWRFTECVLYRCSFARLSGVDYGFQIRHCALVATNLPEITHDHKNGFDHMNDLRGEWNKIDSCDFIDCAVPPTVAWCGENCNFRACTFKPGEAFDSAKDLDWTAFVQDTIGADPQAVWDQHPAKRSAVKHVQPEHPFETTHTNGPSAIPEARFDKEGVRLLVPHLRAKPAEREHPTDAQQLPVPQIDRFSDPAPSLFQQ